MMRLVLHVREPADWRATVCGGRLTIISIMLLGEAPGVEQGAELGGGSEIVALLPEEDVRDEEHHRDQQPAS